MSRNVEALTKIVHEFTLFVARQPVPFDPDFDTEAARWLAAKGCLTVDSLTDEQRKLAAIASTRGLDDWRAALRRIATGDV